MSEEVMDTFEQPEDGGSSQEESQEKSDVWTDEDSPAVNFDDYDFEPDDDDNNESDESESDAEAGEESEEPAAEEKSDEDTDTKEDSGEPSKDDADAGVSEAKELLDKFQKSQDDTEKPTPEAEPQREEVKEEGDKKDDEPDPLDFELDDEIDPDIKDGVDKIKNVAKAQRDKLKEQDEKIAKLENAVTASQRAESERSWNEFCESADSYLANLGEEWQDTFGEGDIRKLPDGAETAKNRTKFVSDVVTLYKAYAQGKPESVPSREEVFRRALMIGFEDKTRNVMSKQVTEKVAKHAKGATHRPSNRAAKKLSGDEAAIAASRALDKKLDLDASEDEEELEV